MKIGIFSDAHGVLGAFEGACSQLKAAGATELLFLGDSIGYVPHLGALRSLIKSQINSVRGNHEEMLISDTIPRDRDEIYQLSFARMNLSPSEYKFICTLPPYVTKVFDGTDCLFVHGSPSDPIKGYVYPDSDLQKFSPLMKQHDIVFMGNTHRPFQREYDGALYINVGSCGLPRDGSRHGTACIFDTVDKEITFVDLDLSEAAQLTLNQTKPSEPIVRYLKHYAGLV